MADQHVEQVLESVGISKEVIAEIKGLAADAKDFTVDKYTAPVGTRYQTQLENDPEFLKKVYTEERMPADLKKAIQKREESGQYGRFITEIKGVLKAKGFSDAEIAQMEKSDDGQNVGLKAFFSGGLDGYGKKVGAPDTLTTLQGQLADALREKTNVTEKQAQLIEEAVNGEKTKSQQQMESIMTMVSIGELNGQKDGDKVFNFVVAPSLIAQSIHDGVKSQYAVILDPATNKFVLRQKDNTALEVILQNGHKLTYAEAATKFAKDNQLLVVAGTGKTESKEKQKIGVGGSETEVPGGIPAHILKAAGIESNG